MAREGEAPGGGILWWNVNDIYRAAFPKATDKRMDEAWVFALSAMRCGRVGDADTLLSLHFIRTIAWVPEGGVGEQQPPIRVGEQKEYKLDLPSKVRTQPFNWLQTARESKETRARAKQQEASSQACGGGVGSGIGGSRK